MTGVSVVIWGKMTSKHRATKTTYSFKNKKYHNYINTYSEIKIPNI